MKNKKSTTRINGRITDVLKNISNDSAINKKVIELLQDIQKSDSHRDNKIKYSRLFDHLQEAVAVYEAIEGGKNFKFVNFNAAAEKIEKIKKEKVIGKKITEVFPGIVEFGLLGVLKQVWETGIPVEHPITFYEDDRILGWRENYIYKLPTGEIVAAYRDVTEQKKAEAELQNSESNLKSLINNRQDSIWSIDTEYNYIIFNDFFKEQYFLAYKVKIEKGINALDLLTPELYNFWKEKYDRALSGERLSFEFSAIFNKDEYFYEVSLNPIISNGEIAGVTASSVDVTQHRNNEIALSESEEKYKIIAKSSVDIIFRINQQGKLLYISESVKNVLGYEPKEIVGKSFHLFLAKSSVLNAASKLQSAFQNKNITNFTTKILHKDGHIINVEINGTYIEKDGELIAQGSIRDITERLKIEKALKESEENYKGIFNSVSDAIYIQDKNGIFVEVNSGAEKMYGYKKEFFINKTPEFISAPGKNDLNLVMNAVNKAYNGTPQKFEYWGLRKNGEIFPKGVTLNPGTYNGEKVVIALAQDISARKEAEEAIRESEVRFKNLIQFAPDSFFQGNELGDFIECNEAATILTGYSRNELLKMNIKSLFGGSMLESKPLRYDLLETGKTIQTERELITKSGKIKSVEMSSKKMKDGTFQSFIRDISKRKQSGIALKESEERYRRILLDLKQAYYEADSDGLITNCNSELALFTGYTENQLIGKRSFSIVHREHWKKVVEDYQKCLLEKTVHFTSEFKVTIKDGRDYWAEQVSYFQYDEEGNFIKVASIVKNITERKKAEKLLKESEKNFRLLFENSPLGTFVATPDGTIVDVNKALLIMLGSPSIEATKQINVLTFPALVKNGYAELFKKCIKDNVTLSLDVSYNSKWGTDNIYSSYLVPLSSVEGKVEKVYTIMEDVSERKKAEKLLKESEEIFRNLSTSTATSIMVYQNERFVFVNNSTEKLTGYSKEELLEMKFWDVVHPDYKELVKERGLNRQKGKKVQNRYEFKLLKKDGSEVWVDFTAGKINWKGEKAGIGSAFDITDKKNAEKEIKKNEEKYRIILNSASDYLFTATISKDLKSRMDWVGGSFEKITGYTFEEYLKHGSWSSTLHPEDVNIDMAAFEELKNNRKAEIEVRIFNKTGKIVWVRCSTSPIWSNKEQRVVSIYGAVKDVTEEKNAELALQESEERYKLISNLTSDYLFSTKIDESGRSIQTWVGGSFKEITGYTAEEYIKVGGWVGTLHPDHIEKDKKAFKKLENNQKTIVEVKTIHKSGKIVWVESFGSPVWDKKENRLIGVNGAVRDITKEKLAALALKASEEKYRLLSVATSDYVFETKIDDAGKNNLVWVGGSFEQITGYTFDEYKKIGGWRAVLHPEDINIDNKEYQRCLKNRASMLEVRTYHKTGKIIWVKAVGYPLWDDVNNKLLGIIGSVKNITKEKEASIALQESKEKYKLISNITSDYIFESRYNDENFLETIWVAGSFKKMTGYSLEAYKEVGGWSKLLYKDDIEIDKRALEELKQNRKAILEVRTVHKSGKIIWIKNSCSPIWDNEKNKLLGVVGAVKDITEEKQTQLIQEIQYNVAKAVVNVNNTNELFNIVRNELLKFIDANNFFVAFYDGDRDLLRASVDFDKEQVRSWDAKKSITGIVIETKKKLFVKKEEIISIAKENNLVLKGDIPEVWLGVPLIISNKVIGAIVVQSYDNPNAYDKLSIDLISVIANQLSLFIERNKAQEDALRLSRAITQSPVSVVITTPDGNIEYVNPHFEKNSGYTFEEVFGKNSRILKSGHHSEDYYKDLWNTLLSGKDWRGELLNKKKNGEFYWENVSISPIENNNGKITHFVAIKEDFTERKQMIQQLVKAKEEAVSSEKIKTEFLAQMSHEIRSPLNVIMSFIGFIKTDLLDGKFPEDMESSFESIETASTRIIRTIDLILNSTDLQQGSYESVITELDVVSTLTKIRNEYKHSAEKKGLELRINLEFNNKKIKSDEYAFIQVISNLVDNAIKYSEKGYIEISAKKDEERGVIIKVQDTGIGMSKEYLPDIFNSFSQEEQGYTRSYDGNGLGMALVKKYCDLINADISVKSTKGKGSTFTLKIPNFKSTVLESRRKTSE